MPQTRGVFPQLTDNIDKRINIVLTQQLKELPAIWRQIFNIETSGKKFERIGDVTGMGDVPEKPEGEAYVMDQIRPGFYKDYTHVEFGLGFEVTETALEDDQYDQLDRSAMWLAFSARVVEEKRAALVFVNGFGSEQTADGVSLFNSAHPLGGGGTARNLLATAADFSTISLSDALVDLQNETKLQSGQVVAPITDLILYIPPALEFVADRVLMSQGLPGSADNDRNPFKARRNWKIIVNPYLTDTDAWFLLAANKRLHGLLSYTRTPITQVPSMTDARTGNRISKVRFRRSWGAWMWQNTFGTPGA